MKRNIILILGLLGYLTYITRYLKVLPYFLSPELLLRIILWTFIAIVITAKLISNINNSTAQPQIHRIKKAPKRKKTKTITPFDKKFKKNYSRTLKRQKPEVQISDSKTAYIESAWDELKKY